MNIIFSGLVNFEPCTMVVLSAAVLTKSGKILVSRQFMPMTRIRIEGLLAAFPKLISDNDQHTFAETEHVRYLYFPLDQLYLLLITNKQSNIMEDLDTMRLLAKVVHLSAFLCSRVEKFAYFVLL